MYEINYWFCILYFSSARFCSISCKIFVLLFLNIYSWNKIVLSDAVCWPVFISTFSAHCSLLVWASLTILTDLSMCVIQTSSRILKVPLLEEQGCVFLQPWSHGCKRSSHQQRRKEEKAISGHVPTCWYH